MQTNFDKKKLLILLLILLMIGGLIYFIMSDNKETSTSDIAMLKVEETTTTSSLNEFYIDIKGSVKNPGVYKFKDNDRVIDAIEKAGGLKKNADTSNINLSKKLTSEMVIYIYNEKEISNKDSLNCNNICNVEVIEVNNCIEESKSESSSINTNLININTATMEELLTLSGIGESKAKSIIDYRSNNGIFKSIEELKNISGIGDSLFNKIKDNITV